MRVSKGKYCAAVNCSNNKGKCPELTFFGFPKDPTRSKKWVINSRRFDLLKKLKKDKNYLRNNYTICTLHFEPHLFMNPQKTKLIADAVPTVFNIPNPPKRTTSDRKPPQNRSSVVLPSEKPKEIAKLQTDQDMRISYKSNIVVDSSDHKEPIGLFKKWFDEACKNPDIKEPNAMAIATATKAGKPSCRNVLMKEFDQHGFVFFTGYNSRKGQEMEENPWASLLFYWQVLHKQIRIEGSIEKVSESESEAYFRSRPRDSQLAALASNQSTRIKDRQELLAQHASLEAKYNEADGLVPRPEIWGGYRLKPERVEFWQGHTNRLHHRVVFRHLEVGEVLNPKLTHQGDEGWVYEFLSP